jgi:hypothetical protein
MPTFILGAGFNVDATAEAGPIFGKSLYIGRHQIECGYRLVGDTLRLCFGLDVLPAGKSIEDLFADALARGDYGPLVKLADRLREADFRIASRLASGERLNCYRHVFDAFVRSHFLTFNYDSLPETFLFRLGRWYPRDGYGLRIDAQLPPGAEEFAARTSSNLVLHLHGSLCIRTSEYAAARKPGQALAMLAKRDTPKYTFDPSSISANFAPFVRDAGADDVEDRIIAPVPDKSQGLKEAAFISDTYTKADALMRDSDMAVVIGYSFNLHDRASYQRLLRALCESPGKKLLVVSPEAGTIANAIRPAFPKLSIEAAEATFKEWVDASFPGVEPPSHKAG